MSDPIMDLHPDALFVVACPICQGHVAASGSLVDHDACCPLCASLFRVPSPRPAHHAAVTEATAGRSGSAADRGGVIDHLAASQREPEPTPRDPTAAVVTEGTASAEPRAEASSPPTDAATGTPPAQLDVADTRPTLEPVHVAAPAASRPVPEPTIDLATLPADPLAAVVTPVDPAAVDLPVFGAAPVSPSTGELAFREPVRTVRIGDEVVEIRRLSPEERQRRRLRRNVMMIVVGVSILLAIVLLFGTPTDRR